MPVELQSMKYFKSETDSVITAAVATDSQVPAPMQTMVSTSGGGSGWTKGLWIISVFFVLIGVTGALSALIGFAMLFVTPMRSNTTGMSHSRKQIVEEFEDAQIAARQKYLPVLIYMQVMKLGLAVGFLASIVMMLQRKARGRSLAVAVCCLALVFHFANLGVGLLVANDGGSLNTLMSKAMDDAAAEQKLTAEQRAEGEAFMKNAMFAGVLIGMSVALLIKIAFYGCIIMHLIQPEVRRIFGEDPIADLAKQNGMPVPA